jgi:hypothetical protein
MAVDRVKPAFRASTLLIDILRSPGAISQLAIHDWETLIWQARAAELLGQLRHRLTTALPNADIPPQAIRHLDVAWKIAALHGQAVRYELLHLREALLELDIPVVLLKGAAYCAQNTCAATGRVFNDIDILVPKASLVEAEKRLLGSGWIPSHLNAYDQRYYREWMHEIPPMEHKNRSTVLDVHHTIVPPTSGIRPSPEALIESSVKVDDPELSFFKVLSPEDMAIHSAAHLFFGEFHKGLRDLYDLHALFSQFSANEGFWERLVARAEKLGLAEPILDALSESQRLFGTDVPEDVFQHLAGSCSGTDKHRFRAWLFDQALRPNHPSAQGSLTHFAQWLIFARSHWLRMPLPLLAYHLGHKAFFRDTKGK